MNEIIDTTLLKCYVQVDRPGTGINCNKIAREGRLFSPAINCNFDYLSCFTVIILSRSLARIAQVNERLVGPLLKHHDNNCHLQESERTLMKFEKWSELVLLYSSKKEHEKGFALPFLRI